MRGLALWKCRCVITAGRGSPGGARSRHGGGANGADLGVGVISGWYGQLPGACFGLPPVDTVDFVLPAR
jgi:hypothetical protein